MSGSVKRGLNASQLKFLACFSMLVDHITAAFLMDTPYWVLLRGFGRLAFPIFAFLVVEGCHKTRSLPDYGRRLFLFALAAQIPFMLFARTASGSVILTFFLAVAAITLYENLLDHYFAPLAALPALFMALMAHWTDSDYGPIGVLLIFVLYLCGENRPAKFITLLVALYLLYLDLFFLFGAAALLPLSLYNGRRGRGGKWFFYWFYPLHLLLLYLIYVVRYIL
ncbi:MAG: conjugal transfer protein TraX [Clostridia bacterium]|nr:conjugal transfer protein TraX [Clostridia bacterium]